MSLFFRFFASLLTLLLLTSCTNKEEKGANTLPYEGRSIMVIAPKLNAGLISGPIVKEAEVFEKKTGAKVMVVRPGWNETVEEITKSFDDPNLHYDVFVITTSWSGPIFAREMAAPIPEAIKKKVAWDDILPIYADNILTWNGRDYALPYDGDTVTLYYRKDLFDDPANKKSFFKRFGYELKPPATWKAYRDTAEFFHTSGQVPYGTLEARLVNTSAMLIFLTKAAAYAKYPGDPAYCFDPETMKPRINNPAFLKALEEYIAIEAFGPEGMNNYAASDVRQEFVKGKAAMAVDWANIGIMAAASPLSVVRGTVGYAQLPGSREVYNAQKHHWEKRFNRVSAMVGNYLFLVNKESKNMDIAFDFAAHMTSRATSGRLTVTAGTGINPSRYSHLENPAAWEAHGFSEKSAAEYLGVLKEAIASPNYIFDIRIPGSARYYKSLDTNLHLAVTKRLTPREALDRTAHEWDAITDSLGRARQIALYKASLNIGR